MHPFFDMLHFSTWGKPFLMLRSTRRHELSLKPWRTLCTWSKVKTGVPLASVILCIILCSAILLLVSVSFQLGRLFCLMFLILCSEEQ